MPQQIELPDAAQQALRQGDKIAAIKILREERGLGLAEAKAMVEQAERGTDPRPQGAPEGKFPLAAVVALKQGDKIGAIKIVRTSFGLGLKEAKDAVEAHLAEDPALRAAMDSVVQRRRPGALLWIVALLVAAGLVYFLVTR